MATAGVAIIETRSSSEMALPSMVQGTPPNPTTKCPWATVSSPPKSEIRLSDIMSEQLADSLQIQEDKVYIQSLLVDDETLAQEKTFDLASLQDLAKGSNDVSGECMNDELIAQMLQMQYNKEYDQNLKMVEQKFNGSSKVSVSLSNYMASPVEVPSDSEEEDYVEPKKAWDSFEAHQRAFPNMSGRGYVKVNNEVVTKHDMTMNSRRNACKAMESLPPCIHTGDGSSFDMQLSNKVYNKLKVYSRAEEDRRTRMHDKSEKATAEWALDQKTKLMLYKMINNEILDKVFGIISTGKESIVLYATGGSIQTQTETIVEVPKECAVKVFKTSLNEFKSRDKYIKDDYRFKDRFSKQNPRKVVHLWAEKEMHNLTRMNKAGIPCPSVVLLKKHILVFSFIGDDMHPAPKLKEVKFPDDDNDVLLRSAYNQTIDGMKKMYQGCKLIHGDLSEFNILWYKDKCYFIDVSQSVEPSHPNGLEFLYRDCTNICTFFSKRRLEDIHTPESLFTYVSGLDLHGEDGPAVLNQIRDYEKNLEHLTLDDSQKFYPFEYCWNDIKN